MKDGETIKKRGRGRPRHEIDIVTISLRIDVDLYDWLKGSRGRKSLNKYINDIIRAAYGQSDS